MLIRRLAAVPLMAGLMLAGCTGGPSSTNLTADSLLAQRVPKVAFHELHMVTESAGWGITSNGVLRTEDGWTTWSNVTPAGVPDVAGTISLFSDADSGWVLVREDSQDNLYVTTDGGREWAQEAVASDDPSVGLYRPLPSTDIQRKMAFRPDGQVGWIRLKYQDLQPQVYVSYDAGATWVPLDLQSLPLPKEAKSSEITTDLPCFFSETDGVIPVYLDQNRLVFMVTHDGGDTWTGSPPLESHQALQAVAAADASHWWVASDSTLYATQDGGGVWTEASNLKGTEELQFATTEKGWAITRTGDIVAFWRSTDGGRTWEKLAER